MAPKPWGPPYDASMMSMDRILEHNRQTEHERAGRSGLAAGHRKDVVCANTLASHPECVTIYGWHQETGHPIQPQFPKASTPHGVAHERKHYCDYSHGARMVDPAVLVDGSYYQDLDEALADPEIAWLLSYDGPLTVLRYITE